MALWTCAFGARVNMDGSLGIAFGRGFGFATGASGASSGAPAGTVGSKVSGAGWFVDGLRVENVNCSVANLTRWFSPSVN